MKSITAGGVSIKYLTGDFREIGFKDYLLGKIRGTYSVSEFWAVKGVTFTLEQGELLGILGRNGAGKSTLLKAVSGIMQPSEGFVDINGKAMYLDYGTGLDGQLSVSENIYLRGAIQGSGRAEIKKNHDAILEFAELTDFKNAPLRTLSSGMKSRLAASICYLITPDILILDEVFAVGDPVFVKKSEAALMRIIKSGITVVMVSHSVAQVRSLATKVLWLDHGKVRQFGETKTVCDAYDRFLKQERDAQLEKARIAEQRVLGE